MKLFVIAGHGAGDPGASGNGYQEHERVRALAAKIKEYGGNNVLLGDFNRNYYKDKGINNLTISKKEYAIIELHMDSDDNVNARGGHVIIKSGFKADKYDNTLADMISTMFPGRANKIVNRSNLANVNRAAAKGYNYRLIECGFISNAQDIAIFNSKIDELAKNILGCFGINAGSVSKPSKPAQTTNTNVNTSNLYDSWIANLQTELNNQGFRDYEGKKLKVDGINGERTLSACPTVKKGAKGNITGLIQQRLVSVGFSLKVDNDFGKNTESKVIKFQKNRGLTQDGIVGKNTWTWLLKGTKM